MKKYLNPGSKLNHGIAKNIFILFLIFFICSNKALSQPEVKELSRKWEISISVGSLIPGPSEKNIGFPSDRISSFQKKIPWSTGVVVPINKSIASTLCISRTGFEGRFVNSYNSFGIVGISPQLTYNLENILFIGGGPALYIVNRKESFSVNGEKEKKIGMEFLWAMKFPQKTLFFAQLNLHLGIAFNPGQYSFANMQATQSQQFIYYLTLPMNKFYVGIGFGIRL